MNKVINKGFRSCRFVSTILKHPVYMATADLNKSVVRMSYIRFRAVIIKSSCNFIF